MSDPSSQSPSPATALWQDVARSVDHALVVCRAEGPEFPVVYANTAFEALSGYEFREVVGRPPWFLHTDRLEQDTTQELRALLEAGEQTLCLAQAYRRDETRCAFELAITPLHDEQGKLTHILATHVEIPSREGGRPSDSLAWSLERGPSRRQLLAHRLTQVLARARSQDRLAGVLMLGVDRYDTLTGTFGHAAADKLVESLAERVGRQLRQEDLVGRVSDSELGVVFSELSSPDDVVHLAQRLLEVVREPFEVGSTEVFLAASVGASVFPMDGEDPESLLGRGEIALRRAQDRGGNTCSFFTLRLQRNAVERLEIETGLRRALEREELSLCYQPQVDLHTGELSGMEALLRWNRGGEEISPARFIPVAEESDLIVQIGEHVLRTACQQVRAWKDAGYRPRRVGVNLSARQFRHHSLVHMIADVLSENGLPAEMLELELTESALMGSESEVLKPLRRLSDMGVQLSIDDFGTGYSSLSYLKHFPIDTLKIDRAFVSSLTQDTRDREITRAIVTMAHALGMQAVAEGVETPEQLTALRQLGCDHVQGFLIARPASADQTASLLVEEENEESFTRRVSGVEYAREDDEGEGECAR